LSQVIKRRVKPGTRAGQYMCTECGEIFDTKKEVDSHRRRHRESNSAMLRNHLSGVYTE